MRLRVLIVSLVLVAVLPVAIFAGLMVDRFFRQERAGFERELRDAVRSLALAADRELTASVVALETLATSPSLDTGDLPAFNRQRDRLRTARPNWEEIAVADPSGQPLSGTTPPDRESLGDGLRRAVETGHSVVTGPVVRPQAGDATVTIITPVRRNGTSRYLLLASVELETLTRTLSQKLPPGWTYRIYDRNDTPLLATATGPGAPSTSALHKARFDGGEGWVKGIGSDGRPVYAAVGRMPLAGWSISLEVPADLLEDQARQSTWSAVGRGLVFLIAGVILASIFGRQIASPVATLSASARAVARGEVPMARTSAIAEVDEGHRAVEDVRARLALAAVERDRVEGVLRVSEQRRAFLADVSATLASSLDYDWTVTKLARLAVPYLADGCVVDLVEASGARTVSVAHVDPAAEAVLWRERRRYPVRRDAHPMECVLRTQHAEVYPVLPGGFLDTVAWDGEHLRMLHDLDILSIMCVPLVTNGRAIGAIAFLATESGRNYSADDLTVALDFARRSAHAIENAQRYREADAARRALEASERRHRLLTDALPQLVWTATPDGDMEYGNQHWLEYTGLAATPIDGGGWAAALHPDDRKEVLARWDEAKAAGQDCEFQGRLRRADGAYRWHLARVVPLRGEGGEIVRWLGTATDIDSQKQAEQTATHANRAKDEFLAVLSHELRTPVTSIVGWVRRLRAAEFDPATLERALAAIERSTTLQVKIINDLLDVSRIVEGQLALEPRPLSLAPLVEMAVETIRPAAAAKSVRVSVFIEPVAFPVRGDPARLEQVFGNLLSNAVEFTPDGGVVTVTLQRVDDEARVAVIDTGEGIPAEFLPQVFERFSQAPRSVVRSAGGLGLGLAIVRHLVERHGGTIRAESPGVGQGATFTLTLPLLG
jgi:PAS domain S-box-containing protein